MKRNTISKPVLILLVTGLMLTSVTPLISRYLPLPDFVKGFLAGLGIALELVALVKSQREKKGIQCASTKNIV